MLPIPIMVQALSLLLPRVGVTGGEVQVIAQLVTWVIGQIETALDAGVDPATLDWDRLYGRSPAELRAQVEAQQAAAARPRQPSTTQGDGPEMDR